MAPKLRFIWPWNRKEEKPKSIITRDMVQRANESLMRGTNNDVDVYAKHGLKRPTRSEIEAAAKNAMQRARKEGWL